MRYLKLVFPCGLLLIISLGLMTACGGDAAWNELDEYSSDGYFESPEDCLSDEVYDEEDGLCYIEIECETEEECEDLDPDLLPSLEEIVEKQPDEPNQRADGDYPEGEEILVTYEIRGNQILNPEIAEVSADLQAYQEDTEKHQEIWIYFANLIPQEYRISLTTYVIFTDGEEEAIAGVEQETNDPTKWLLTVDIMDSEDPTELTYTLIHEFGHLLTLNSSQVIPDTELFYHPDSESLEATAVALCPNYFPGEGCSQADSFLNLFYNRFWVDIYDEWAKIETVEDDDLYYALLDEFYSQYQDQFVTDYAATNPEEDIAESWTYFVLKPKPDGDTIAEEKVLFFYEWPELVELREKIVSRTLSRLRRN